MTFAQVLSHFGSHKGVADALGIKAPSVYGWEKSGVPVGRQFQIQIITGGKLQADANAKAAA